jgi:hypothetical protein
MSLVGLTESIRVPGLHGGVKDPGPLLRRLMSRSAGSLRGRAPGPAALWERGALKRESVDHFGSAGPGFVESQDQVSSSVGDRSHVQAAITHGLRFSLGQPLTKSGVSGLSTYRARFEHHLIRK